MKQCAAVQYAVDYGQRDPAVYTGVDVADCGADPGADAVLTIDEMEHLIAPSFSDAASGTSCALPGRLAGAVTAAADAL